VGQPRVHPVPGGGHGLPVPGGQRARGDLRSRPGRRVSQRQFPAVLTGPAHGAGLARRRRQLHHPVAAQPPEQLHRQVRQQPGQPGHVVAGVEDDQDGRVAFPPVPSGGQPGDHVADLDRGYLGLVVTGPQPHRVQHRGPRGPPRLQRRDHRIRPARDHLRLPLPAPVDVAEQPLRAGRRARPQPVAHIGGQHQPPIGRPRQRQGRHRPAQPADGEPAMIDRVIQRAVAAPVLRGQRQPGQRLHRPIRAQHRIGQLEQLITARGQAGMEIQPEP
jgi:hypothetical protein